MCLCIMINKYILKGTVIEPTEIIVWALGHGFKQTGVNAYSADYEGTQYQMVL